MMMEAPAVDRPSDVLGRILKRCESFMAAAPNPISAGVSDTIEHIASVPSL